MTKAEQYFIKTTKAAIERYKGQIIAMEYDGYKDAAMTYEVVMLDSMETLKAVQRLIDAAEYE